MSKARTMLALDIETESTTEDKNDALDPFKSRITCIGIVGQGHAKVYRAPWDSFIREIYNNDDYSFVMHNGKFDLKHMHFKFGAMPNWKERYAQDTRYMAFVCTDKIPAEYLEAYEARRKELNEVRKNKHREAKQHSLKTLAPYFLGVDAFWEPDESHDSDEYVLKDCEYTYKLHSHFNQKLSSLGEYDFYYNKLMPWSKVVLQAELQGIELDVDLVNQLQKQATEDIRQISTTLREEWKEYFSDYTNKVISELNKKYQAMFQAYMEKHPNASLVDSQLKYVNLFERSKQKLIESGEADLNLDSPSQLKWLLKDKLGLDVTNLEGDESTDKEVLNKLAREDKNVGLLLKLRKATKLATAFFPKYLDLKTTENKIHCDFNIDGTRTGRLSSSNPNLQQVPRDFKHILKASEGWKFVTYDVTAIEPLLMAYYSEDPALTNLIQEGKSLHSVNARIMFNLDCTDEEVKEQYPVERQIAKTIGLACLYGAGWRQVQLSCQKEGIFFSEAECKGIVKRIRETYSGVWSFKGALDAEMEKGEVIYNLMGRPIKFESAEDVYMKALNTLIQGSASDLVLDIAKEIDEHGALPILFVHDSIVTQIPEWSPPYFAEQIAECFRRKLTNSITTFTLSIDGGVSNVWE